MFIPQISEISNQCIQTPFESISRSPLPDKAVGFVQFFIIGIGIYFDSQKSQCHQYLPK